MRQRLIYRLSLGPWLLVILLLAGVMPLSIFALWPHSRALELELAEVKERHLLLARHLGGALDRYGRDLDSVFGFVGRALEEGHRLPDMTAILENLNFVHICLVDRTTGEVRAAALSTGAAKPAARIPPELLAELQVMVGRGQRFGGVRRMADGRPGLLLAGDRGGHLALGLIDTRYLVDLAQRISFGVKGHAVIVDGVGRVIAHPMPDWIASMRDLAGLPIVGRMRNGETGIERFYSPALRADMVAGFTAVPATGWGVMVPQPLGELEDKAAAIRQSAMLVMGAALFVTLLIVWALSRQIVTPLQSLAAAVKRLPAPATGDSVVVRRFTPREVDDLATAFNAARAELDERRWASEQHTSELEAEVHNRLAAEARVRHMAMHDELTGLPNRRMLADRLKEIIARDGGGFAVHCLDLNDFKGVNDTLGHAAGDELLRHVAQRLQAAVRDGDLVARLGGDEFAILQTGGVSEASARTMAERVAQSLAASYRVCGHEVRSSVSIGIATGQDGPVSADELLDRADRALYASKERGPGAISFFDQSISRSTDEMKETKRELEEALRLEQLVLLYQPIVDLATGKTRSIEALVRWQHPRAGMLAPDRFLASIESLGLSLDLGEYVIRQACRAASKLRDGTGATVPVAINLSAGQLRHQQLPAAILRHLAAHDLPPSAIEIEVTEDMLFDRPAATRALLEQIRAIGVRIALDDFGTGFASFGALRQFPIDSLKIDSTFVREMLGDKEIAGMVRAIVQMSRAMQLPLVAECIETPEQAAFLAAEGIELGQGYLFARPMSLVDIVQRLDAERGEPLRRSA